MMWRYNRWHARFDQPDPYDGSYDLADPQSLNRYSYTQGDPVNFVDPSGLDLMNNPPWRDSNPGFIPAWQNGWNRLAVYNQLSFHNETMRATAREFWSPQYEGEPPPDFSMYFLQQYPIPGHKVPTPPFVHPTQEKRRKQQIYDACWEREVEKLKKEFHPKLEEIMQRNLTQTLIGAAGGGIPLTLVPSTQSAMKVMGRGPNLTGIGISLGVLGPLYSWRAELLAFERDQLGPAREAAKARCRKEAGL